MREEFVLKVKSSKDNQPVPVVNDVYLHSMYQPGNEAQVFAEGYRESLKTKNNILILGLGFVYHINAVIEILKQYHSEYNIIVIEPSRELYSEVRQRKLIKESVVVLTPEDASALYGKGPFVDFLLDSPLILKHDPSFNLHLAYYKGILSYNAPVDIQTNVSLMNDAAKSFFSSSDTSSWDQCISNAEQTNNNNNFLFALNEIANTQDLK